VAAAAAMTKILAIVDFDFLAFFHALARIARAFSLGKVFIGLGT